MTSPTLSPVATGSGAASELVQETLALTRRLFLQLTRRPSTLIAGILQPLIWLILFGALFAKAPEGLLPGGISYGRFLGAGVIVFTAFSGALNAGLPVMFDREFGFLNRLLVAPLRSRSSIVLASVLYITVLSLLQSPAIMLTAAVLPLPWRWPAAGVADPVAACVCRHGPQPWSGVCLPGHIELIAVIFANLCFGREHGLGPCHSATCWPACSLNPLTFAIEPIRCLSRLPIFQLFCLRPLRRCHRLWLSWHPCGPHRQPVSADPTLLNRKLIQHTSPFQPPFPVRTSRCSDRPSAGGGAGSCAAGFMFRCRGIARAPGRSEPVRPTLQPDPEPLEKPSTRRTRATRPRMTRLTFTALWAVAEEAVGDWPAAEDIQAIVFRTNVASMTLAYRRRIRSEIAGAEAPPLPRPCSRCNAKGAGTPADLPRPRAAGWHQTARAFRKRPEAPMIPSGTA